MTEQGFQRITDHSYSAAFEPNTTLDIEAVNSIPRTRVEWVDGSDFLDWYFKPIEQRYPLDPNFKTKAINDRELYDEEEDLFDLD